MKKTEYDIAKNRIALINSKKEWSKDEIQEIQLLISETTLYELSHLPVDATDQEILKLLAEGKSSVEIGKTVFLSPRTIDNRVQKLSKFYKAKNRAHLIAIINATEKE